MQENNANEILKKEVNEAKTELNEMKKAKEQEKKSKNRNFIQSWFQKRLMVQLRLSNSFLPTCSTFYPSSPLHYL